MTGPRTWYRDPWRKPHLLHALTWGYLAWSLVPVLIAILISFNGGRSAASFQSFSFQWWNGAPQGDAQGSLFTSPELHAALVQTIRLSLLAMVIAVPLGVSFAIGLDRWRGRVAGTANLVMLVSFIVPEIIIGIALFFTFTYTFHALIKLGSLAQVIGLVVFEISYPVIIVRARLLSIGKEYEEAAMDLGAPPRAAIRRVLLPMLYPAIFASVALVFADSVDDFVTVRYLSGGASTETLSVKIYGAVRGTPTPVYNAAAAFMLLSTLVGIAIVYALYKQFGKGQGGSAADLAAQL